MNVSPPQIVQRQQVFIIIMVRKKEKINDHNKAKKKKQQRQWYIGIKLAKLIKVNEHVSKQMLTLIESKWDGKFTLNIEL